jgi:hypothetical protein
MTKAMLQIFGAAVTALLLIAPVGTAATSSGTVQRTRATAAKAVRSAWPPETLQGKVVMVDPAQHLMVVQSPDGVPFDMKLTGATALHSGGERLKAANIDTAMNKDVTVQYRPERAGDIATSVQIQAQK